MITPGTTVVESIRVAWRTVGTILERHRGGCARDRFVRRLRRIGINEIGHRKGQPYLTAVVDHHASRLVWAAPSRDRRSVPPFVDALGEERGDRPNWRRPDMATWMSGPIAQGVRNTVRRVDPFLLAILATAARGEVWNEAPRQGNLELAREPTGARAAVWKTRRTSPTANKRSPPRSSRRTPAHTGPTCWGSGVRQTYQLPSKRRAVRSSVGWGRVAVGCRRS